MIKKFALPQRCSRGRRPRPAECIDPSARVTFLKAHKIGQHLCVMFWATEKMDMIRHYDVPTNCPAVPQVCVTPFFDQNMGDMMMCQDPSATHRARCNKINGRIDPDALQASQMLVHCVVVTECVEFGNAGCSVPHIIRRGQRPQLQAQLERKFRVYEWRFERFN